MALVVTPEMRRAVCAEVGHELAFDQLVTSTGRSPSVENADGKVPHIRCARCHVTWLVIEQPGDDYADAEAKLSARLRDGDALKGRLGRGSLAKP